MSKLQIWLMYVGITAILAVLAFCIPEKSNGLIKFIKNTASVFFVLVAITLAVLTFVLVLEPIAPYFGSFGGSGDNGQEQCVPDPFGGC